MAQRHDGLNIQPYLSKFFFNRRPEKVAGGRNTSIVDQQVDLVQLLDAPDQGP